MPRHMPLTLAQEDIKVFEAEENKVSEAEETWSRPKVPLHAFASDCTAAPGPNPKTAVAAATTPEKDDAEKQSYQEPSKPPSRTAAVVFIASHSVASAVVGSSA